MVQITLTTYTSPCWQTLQLTMRQKRTSVLQDLLAGMAGHIGHDLPYALCMPELDTQTGESHIDDYHRVNDVLGQAIPALRKEVEERYDPWLRWLDRVGRAGEDLLTNDGIRLSRSTAWYNARRLLDPLGETQAKVDLETSPLAFVDQLFKPPFFLARVAVQIGSIVISLGRRWPKPPPPDAKGPTDLPNQRYYFGTGAGKWRGTFGFAVTSWSAFWRAHLNLANRFLVVGVAVIMAVFRRARIDSVIVAFPDQGSSGIATNDVRISLFGITLYNLSEQYALNQDGVSVFVRSYERFGPIPFIFNVEKAHPATITEEGRHATYYIPLLGADWIGEYTVQAGENHIQSALTCPWASATESIYRVPVG